MSSTSAKPSIYICYGSESGNAHTLAFQLKLKLLAFSPTLYELNELDLTKLTADDTLLVITSTTGDGAPPSNANGFYINLARNKLTTNCQYAVFGLGDTKYENFCGFSIIMDAMLKQAGATQIANRVDADVDFEDFYETWANALVDFFKGKENAAENLQSLQLQVNPFE